MKKREQKITALLLCVLLLVTMLPVSATADSDVISGELLEEADEALFLEEISSQADEAATSTPEAEEAGAAEPSEAETESEEAEEEAAPLPEGQTVGSDESPAQESEAEAEVGNPAPADDGPAETETESEEESLPETEEPEKNEEAPEFSEVLTASLDYIPESTADSESLLDAYAEQQINGALRKRRMLMAVANPTRGMSAPQAYVYSVLKDAVTKTAAGELTSTEYTVSFTGESTIWITEAETLGYESFSGDNINEALGQIVGLNNMLQTLLNACPYELYWFDKTVGIHLQIRYQNSSESLKINSVCYRFAVAREYSAGTYQVDGSSAEAINAAVANARAIVAEASGLSDLEKLRFYKNRICSLTDYNSAAAGSAFYGNPWQMIWVFDGNSSTNVVCEGYAKAFQYLCDLSSFNLGIYCISVTGDNDGERHAWNLVHMEDGKSYLVDVTNCDIGSAGSNDLFMKGYSARNGNTWTVASDRFSTRYTYDESTLAYYTDEELNLSPEDYGTAHEHTKDTAVRENEIEASCTEDGSYDEVVRCKKCGEELSRVTVTVPALGHQEGTPVRENEIEASCTEDGSYDEVICCSVCEEEMSRKTVTVPAKGHSPVLLNRKEATCEETGYTGDMVCSVCGEVLEAGEEIPKLIVVPKAQQLIIRNGDGEIVSGKTVYSDINSGAKLSFSAAALPEAADQNLSWTLSDKTHSYADYLVEDNTVIVSNGQKNGSVTLTVTANDGSRKSARVTVRLVRYASSIQILENSAVSRDGDTYLATAGQSITWRTDLASDRTLTDRNVLWSVSGEGAGISNSGRLSLGAVSEPTAVRVTAQVRARPEISDSVDLMVYPAAKSVQILYEGSSVAGSRMTEEAGSTFTLQGSILPETAVQGCVWSSSNSSVVSVDEATGSVQCLKKGSATLTCRQVSGRLSARVSIQVIQPVENISLSLRSGSLPLAARKSVQLAAAVSPSDASNRRLTWSCSDPSAATVSGSGRVTAKAVSARQTVTVTATAADGSGVTASYDVVIVPTATAVRILADGTVMNGKSMTASVGDQIRLTAAVFPDGELGVDQTVSWRLNSSRLASLDSNGVLTILAKGNLRVLATTVDGSRKSATMTIRIS